MHNRSVAPCADGRPRLVSRRSLFATVVGGLLILLAAAPLSSRPASAETPTDSTSGWAAGRGTTQEIVAAKTRVANLYAAVRAGSAAASELRRAEAELGIMTGERIAPVSAGGRDRLARDFSPFRQVTDYYCGPATVQSMLWFLGVRDEDAAGADIAGRDGMTGRADFDQAQLANDSWLGTEAFAGTNWGDTVPNALNAFRGTSWYAAFGTPNVEGTLDKEQAMRDIVYAIDHGYPVAANVFLSDWTLIPDGFSEGFAYEHWETIVGYFDRDGTRYVKIGQVYGEGDDYDPLQEIPWDKYWPAIENWHGIVW